MDSEFPNIAYIDAANLYIGARSEGFKIDYKKFRHYLKVRFCVGRARLFIGYMEENISLYKYLEESGFEIEFKAVVRLDDGTLKGNCDADLVLAVVKDFYEGEFKQAVIVSSDGDFQSLVNFLKKRRAIRAILSPCGVNLCSTLLKSTGVRMVFLQDVIQIRYEKPPLGPEP